MTGRPTKYKPEYCELLIKHMEQGLSFEAFSGKVGVNQDTLYAWVKKFPAFSEAKKIGTGHSRLFWETLGIAGSAGKIKNFNVGAWIFNMKNRFHWRDAQQDAAPPPQENSEKIKSMFALIDRILDDLPTCWRATSEPELPSLSQ